jgi:hypothetical protein
MMLFHMKALACLTLAAVCGSALSISYYFLYTLPHIREESERLDREQKQAAQNFEMTRRCQEDGNKFFNEYFRQTNERGLTWDTAEFHYSRKLNTCLIFTRYIQSLYPTVSLHYNELHDIYSSRLIIQGHFKRDTSVEPWKEEPLTLLDDTPNYMSDQFLKEKEKLFRE